MTRRTPKRRNQFPKSRKGLTLSPRVDRYGRRINRWIRLTPSARGLRNLPPSKVEIDLATTPTNPFATKPHTPLSSRSVEEQQQWAAEAGQAGAHALVAHAQATDPTFASAEWRGVHHEDMVRLGAETLDFIVSVEREEGFEFEPYMVRRFAAEAEIWGTHHALARIGHPSAFSAFEDDPEMRAALIRKARLAIPPHIHVDADGFIRLFPHESGAGE